MARKRLTSLPEGLWSKLAELEAYVRQLAIVRGIGWTLAIAAIALGLGLLADITLDLPLIVRVGLLAAAGLVTLASAYAMIWRPWRRHRSVLDLAAVVERAHPELKECLVSCIELYDTTIPESERGSELMRELSAKQALQNVSPLDFCDSVSSRPAHRMALGGLLAWGLLLLPLLLPSNYRLLMTRFFTPWQNLDRVTSFWFEVERGDRVVVRGSDVTLAAHPKGAASDFPAIAELNWVNEQGESDSRRVDYDASTGLYSTTIPHVMHGFQYDLSGAGNRSRTYRIQVVEAPAITGLKVKIQPPAYTGQPAKMLDGAAGEITVLERSRLHWQLTFNKPLQAAEWQWQVDHGISSKPAEAAPQSPDQAANAVAEPTGPPAIPFKLSADRLSATWESIPQQGGAFRLAVRDEHGLTNDTDGTRQLIVTPDTAPTLTVSGNHEAEVAQASDVVPVKVDATDDVGIGALELHYEIDSSRKGIVKCAQKELGKPQVQHQFDLNLTDLQLKNGEIVSYRVRAADERPEPGPNETWSEQRMIRIDAKAKPPGTQQLALDQQQMQQFLKQLHDDVTAQQKQAKQLQTESAELANDDPAAARELQRELEKAADEQAKLQARLEQLAAAFENHPLFANLAQQAQQLAATEFQQAQAALSAAEQAAGKERTDKLQSAEDQLAKADEKLDALEQRFDKIAKLEQDLLELNRLAANADQLAQRLKALDQKQREPVPLQETEQERANREQLQKAEANQLVAQQKELTQKAAELLQKQPELQQAARQNQLEQLAQLTQRAEQLAQPQQALAEELRGAAEKSARDNEALAERQAELQKQIEKLNEQVAEKRPPGVKPIDPAELEKAIEELRAGNLGEAAKEEERLAKQLDELEKKLQAANQTTAEQAQKLADQQAAAAKAAQAAAQDKAAPAKEKQEAAAEQLADAKEELKKLAPEQAEKEQQAAESALADAAEKQQELADKSTKPDPESKATPAEKEQELERLLKENADAQQAAAEALQKLADELKPPASEKAGTEGTKEAEKTEVAASDKPKPKAGEETEKLDSLEKPKTKSAPPEKPAGAPEGEPKAAGEKSSEQKSAPPSKPEGANAEGAAERPKTNAQQAAKLAQEARDLQQELAQAQQAQDLSQQQEKQKKLTETLRQLNEEIQQANERMQQAPAAKDPASKEKTEPRTAPESAKSPSDPGSNPAQNKQAQAAMEEAQRELEQGNLERSAAAGQKAAEALQQLAQESGPQADPKASNTQPSSKENPTGQRPMPADGEQTASPEKNAPEGAIPKEAAGQVADAVKQLQEALSTPPSAPPVRPNEPQPGGNTETAAKPPTAQSSQPEPGNETPRSPMGESKAGEAQPGEPKSGESKSGESKSGESKSGGAPGSPGKSSGGQSGSGQGSTPASASGKAGGSGQPGSAQGQSSPSSDSNGPESQPSQNAMQSAAQRLQRAATALRQANAQWQSKGSGGKPQAGEPEEGAPGAGGRGVPSEKEGNGKPGLAGDADVDTANLARLKKRLAGRKWGELPGTLQTEILQAAQKKPNSEYGELIRQYFKEIAKTQPATTAP
ncbi:MAG: hypothetical protein JWN70_4540 [Planctomycetaceae bacterium]|nr:hypothetical protein [Planctomycetaceae bacterium]